ncbi:MAG TPA: S9 family peptidase [Kofleriaceae bacterium]|jgi:dipeptidyl aminopeptidase/acylaminoacyl peptidase
MKRLVVIALVACGGSKAPTPTPPARPDPAPVAATPAPPAGHPRSDLIPRALLFGNPERRAIELSPDGRRISWLAPLNGVMNLWVAPVDKLDQALPVTEEQTRPIRQYYWAFTSKHLIYLQDSGGDENFHAFRVDLGVPGVVRVTDLTPYKGARAEVIGLSEHQPTALLVNLNDRTPKLFDLYKVDLLTAKRTLVVQNDDNLTSYTFDDNLGIRFASRKQPDGSDQLLVPETKAGKLGWKVYDTVPVEDTDTTRVLGIVPGGKAAYMTDSRGRDTAALVSVDIASKKQTVLAQDARADAGEFLMHPTRHNLQAVGFDYERTSWKVLDASIQGDLDALAKLEGGDVHVVSRTLDDHAWIALSTSDQHPGRYYLWDRNKHKATFLFASRPELENQPLVKMWPIVIESRDHQKMVSYLTLPAAADPDGDGKANQPGPMVLLVHGGPWGRDSWGYNTLHQLLANRGYAVLSVNFRGSVGFGKKFVNAGNLEWGKAMHQDLIDAVQWAIGQKVAPADQIAIMGGSYGGYATLAGLTLTPDVFRCGVDIVGPSNLLTLLASIPPYWAPLMTLFKQRIGDPETAEGKALLTAASPLTHAAQIRRPLLIGQGANDPRVKQAESEQIVKAMKDHRLPVTYIVFPDEGHGFARPPNNIAFYGAAEAFLSVHLGGSYAPLSAEEIKASTMQVKEGKTGVPGL